jgi:hypothetical protein
LPVALVLAELTALAVLVVEFVPPEEGTVDRGTELDLLLARGAPLPELPCDTLLSKLLLDLTLESDEGRVGRVELEALLEGLVLPLLDRRNEMSLLTVGNFPVLSLFLLEASLSIVPLVLSLLLLVELVSCLNIPRGGVVDPLRLLREGDVDDDLLSASTVMLLMGGPSTSSPIVLVLDALIFSSSGTRANAIVIPFRVNGSASVLLGLLTCF